MLLKKGKKHMVPQTFAPDAKVVPICAHCREEMVEVFVRSIGDENEDIMYRCVGCGAQQTRTTKPVWSV